MNRENTELYQSKLMTAAEAVKIVKSGDRVYTGTASSGAYALMEALWNRRHELENVTILSSNVYQYSPLYDDLEDHPFHYNTYFMGINERKRLKSGAPITFNSLHLSRSGKEVLYGLLGKPIALPVDLGFRQKEGSARR